MASHSQFHSISPTDSIAVHDKMAPTPALSEPSCHPTTVPTPSTTNTRRNFARSARRVSMTLSGPALDSCLIFGETRKQFKQVMEDGHGHHDAAQEIAISATGESAGKNITPFLSKHIPTTYNPMGTKMISTHEMTDSETNNTTYCNRHRPDRKCRRQADGPSMDQLQTELSSLSQADRAAISQVWSVFSAAPGKQRQLILQGLLSVACYSQLSFVSAQVRDLIKIDFISLLPTEISLQILSNLDTVSLCKSAQVSRSWRELADSDVPWRSMCSQHLGRKCTKCGWGLPVLERRRLRQEQRQRVINGQPMLKDAEASTRAWDHVRADGNGKRLHEHVKDGDDGADDILHKRQRTEQWAKRPWKAIYRDRFKVGSAWRHGRYQLKVLKGHTNGVTCMQVGDCILGNDILATGSYDTTLRMWSKEGNLLQEFKGHTSGVRCLLFDHKQLISGGLDNKVLVFEIATGRLMKTLEGPQSGVLSLSYAGNYLVAGSMDKSIYIWNHSNRKSFRINSAASDFVNSVVIDAPSSTILAASDDCTVRLWDLETRKLVQSFHGHVGPVQQAIYMPPEFELEQSDLEDLRTDDTSESDTDVDEGSGTFTLQNGHQRRRETSPPPSLENIPLFPDEPDRPNPPAYMLSCGLDATLRLWHVASGRCLRTFFGHLEGIWSVKADNLRIASVGEDGMVKLWSPTSGTCERTFTGHQGPVTCVALTPERLYTAGEDSHIRVMTFGEARQDEDEEDGAGSRIPAKSI